MGDVVKVTAGDWVLFRSDASYDKVSVDVKQAAKVTPALVKFDGGYPRQCNARSVVAAFSDEATAKRVRDSIAGVAGEYNRRRRLAEDEYSARLLSAYVTAKTQVERLVQEASA